MKFFRRNEPDDPLASPLESVTDWPVPEASLLESELTQVESEWVSYCRQRAILDAWGDFLQARRSELLKNLGVAVIGDSDA